MATPCPYYAPAQTRPAATLLTRLAARGATSPQTAVALGAVLAGGSAPLVLPTGTLGALALAGRLGVLVTGPLVRVYRK